MTPSTAYRGGIMGKIKCHICKAKNKDMVCERCGTNINDSSKEHLVLTSSGYILYNDNGKNVNQFSSCKFSITNKRIFIYKIKPDAKNPAFDLLKDLANAISKNPHFSIALENIELLKKYDTKHEIQTKNDTYYVWLSKYKEFDQLQL